MGSLLLVCCLCTFFSWDQSLNLLRTAPMAMGHHMDSGATLLEDLDKSTRDLEQRLWIIEGTIHGAKLQAPQTSVSQTATPSILQAAEGIPRGSGGDGPERRWRDDYKCGNLADPLPSGDPAECNPKSKEPCCSPVGWCGGKPAHCKCKGCVDYRRRVRGPNNPPHSSGMRQRNVPSESDDGQPSVTSHSSHDGQTGKTVVVIIPFRDRESHLEKFKPYWRSFAKNAQVQRWEIYVVEQFDSMAFNRGWNFNVGLAIASAQTAASPDVTESMRVEFACAVIQDIDYLPEDKVDYAECSVPTQLSAEIDRYDWKVPYLQSAGGIVGMSLHDWRTINGFGNDYFGWGGEDDELFHRLRLNGLLYGDCYPFCKKNRANRVGQSIRRPRKGFGRFSGKYMHSANHTDRISNATAYKHNLEMLAEIQSNGRRWRSDGLSSLAFRILDTETDEADSRDFGIVYHHVRVRRGLEAFDLSGLVLALPPWLCGNAARAANGGEWLVQELGIRGAIPWDLAALRARVGSLASQLAPGGCNSVAFANFILLDRRQHTAKILSDNNPRLLTVFYRSLSNPAADGLIIADVRTEASLRQAFVRSAAFVVPTTQFTVCTADFPKGGPKYSIFKGNGCGTAGWEKLHGAHFQAYAKPREGFQVVSVCNNERHWTQRFVASDSCEGEWSGLTWKLGIQLWVQSGGSFCVGTRDAQDKEQSFSRVLPQERCDGSGFMHSFGFDSTTATHPVPFLLVCIGREGSGALYISQHDDCQGGPRQLVARFPAWAVASAGGSRKVLCAEATISTAGDTIREADSCQAGRGKFSFAVPTEASSHTSAWAQRLPVCISEPEGGHHRRVGTGIDCKGHSYSGALHFEMPSLLDILASTPGPNHSTVTLYAIVEEEAPCAGFVCPRALR